MGFFKKRKNSNFEEFHAQMMDGLMHSPMGLWASTHRARITMKLSSPDSKPSDTDGSIRWELLSPLITTTAFFTARITWLGKTEDRNAELFVVAIMHCLASFLATQQARLSEEDRMMLALAPMPEFEIEFGDSVEFEIGSLANDASQAIAQGMSTPGGKNYFNQASELVVQFWSTGHPIDAQRIGEHFLPMLNSVK
tara:strand:+ start:75790 stop:76377 length:588 start_codon:yes stop_codon:yes gene_type:complete